MGLGVWLRLLIPGLAKAEGEWGVHSLPELQSSRQDCHTIRKD